MPRRFPQKVAPNLTEVRATARAGRGLFATQNIEDHGQILGIQRPLVIALDAARLDDHCYNCLGYTSEVDKRVPPASEHLEMSNFVSCQHCAKVKYCSKRCRKDSWEAVHQYECKAFSDMPQPLANAGRALLQLLILKRTSRLPAGELDAFSGLTSNVQHLQQTNPVIYGQMFALAGLVKGYSGARESVSDLCDMLGKMANNAFTMVSTYNDAIGTVIHPVTSLMNHSCKPNAFVRFNFDNDGIKMDVRATGKIARGEEIFLSYIDETDPIYRRRGTLRKQYNFICECAKCAKVYQADEEPPLSECAGPPCVEETNAFDLVDSMNKDEVEPEAIERIEQAIYALRKQTGWSVLHRQPLASLRHALILAYQRSNIAWSFAQACLRHSAIDPHQYPYERHVSRLVHQFYLINETADIIANSHAGPDLMLVRYPVVHWALLKDLYEKIKPDVGAWTFADIVANYYQKALASVDKEIVRGMPTNYAVQVENIKHICESLLEDEKEGFRSRPNAAEDVERFETWARNLHRL